jgi:hypothetical protein
MPDVAWHTWTSCHVSAELEQKCLTITWKNIEFKIQPRLSHYLTDSSMSTSTL